MNNFQNSELFVSMLKRIYFLYLMSLRYFSRLFIATQNLTLITNVQQYDCMYVCIMMGVGGPHSCYIKQKINFEKS